MNASTYREVFPNGAEKAFPVRGGGGVLASAGMTLRDYFAAKALAVAHTYGSGPEYVAEITYKFADAMMEARKL